MNQNVLVTLLFVYVENLLSIYPLFKLLTLFKKSPRHPEQLANDELTCYYTKGSGEAVNQVNLEEKMNYRNLGQYLQARLARFVAQ